VIDVSAKVGEALLVVAEPFEEVVRHALAELTELDRLFGDPFLESDDFAPRRRTCLPYRSRTFECAVLVEQRMPESWPTCNAPHRRLKFPGNESEDRRLAGAVAPMMPHRSPSATVKVMFLNSSVAPKETPMLDSERRVTQSPE
jgi:hypothetical protein